MARSHIEILATDVRSDHLLIAKVLLNLAQHILQAETQVGALRQPDRKTLAHAVGEHKEFHLLTDLAMVALLGFLKHDEILVEHLFFRERHAIETLHLLALGIAAPEGTSHTGELHSLDETCRHEVRAATEVGEPALGVC